MSHHHEVKHHPYCLNCHYPLSEFDKNCSQCGQKPTDGRTTMHDLLHEFVHTLFHLDGKLFWTLKHLFVPGKLTTEFFKGHHKRYAHPVQLFLVLGALAFGVLTSKAHETEEELAKSIEKSRDKVSRNKFLLELDSVSQSAFKSTDKEQLFRDSLMLKMIYPKGLENSEEDLRKRMGDVIDKQMNKKRNGISFHVSGSEAEKAAFKDSLINVLLNENADSARQVERQKMDSIRNGDHLAAFTEGMKVGLKEAATDQMKEKLKIEIEAINSKRDIKEAIKIKEDSVGIFEVNIFGRNKNQQQVRIPKSEIYELTPDSILTKYNIEGFREKIQAKQFLKVQREGNNFFHYFMSKLFLMTFALIPVLAGVLMLVYRRQKRYFVEHVVFLMHYNTALFLGLTISLLVFPYWENILAIFFLWMAIHFFMSLKFYYNQGWGKTFVKYCIMGSAYFFMSFLFLIITAVIGFILF